MLYSEFDSERVLIYCRLPPRMLRGGYVFSLLVVLYFARGRFTIIALALGALMNQSKIRR